MIDRSYLPFQSAREHQDRGMLKWMGFFLSEHTSSLNEEKLKENISTELTLLDKLKMISQLYAGQYQGNFTYKEKNRKKNITGTISEISQSEIVIKSKDKFQLIQIEDILQIELWEVDSLVKKRNLRQQTSDRLFI